jgi:hypothetical protein
LVDGELLPNRNITDDASDCLSREKLFEGRAEPETSIGSRPNWGALAVEQKCNLQLEDCKLAYSVVVCNMPPAMAELPDNAPVCLVEP